MIRYPATIRYAYGFPQGTTILAGMAGKTRFFAALDFGSDAPHHPRRMSPFEIVMLICFGAAWPFSIHRSWRSRTTAGKSLIFLWTVEIGYCSGIIHKIVYNPDGVVFFYALNALLVGIDLAIYYRNLRIVDLLAREETGAPRPAPS
jgi:hypothetical protein